MKALAVVILILACAAGSFAQSYSEIYKAPYSRTYYGAATFKADSHYVWSRKGWVTVTVSYDTTAGTTVGYFCAGNDSTNAIAIRPGTGGAYGDVASYRFKDLFFYRLKGAIPHTVTIE